MPAPDQGSTEWVDISDFTPGVMASYASAGANPARVDPQTQSSYAQVEDTWGCYGHPGGGLHPLPGVVQTITDSMYSLGAGYTGSDTYLMSTHCLSPVTKTASATPSTLASVTDSETPDLLQILFSGLRLNTSTSARHKAFQVVQYRLASSAGVTRVLLGTHSDIPIGRGKFRMQPAHITQVTSGTYYNFNAGLASIGYKGWQTVDLRIRPGHRPGRIGFLYTMDGYGSGLGSSYARIWPKMLYVDASDTTLAQGMFVDTWFQFASTSVISSQTNESRFVGYLALTHQNRYVYCQKAFHPSADLPWGDTGVALGGSGAGSGYVPAGSYILGSGDFWKFTPPNDLAGNQGVTYDGALPGASSSYVYPYVETAPSRFGGATTGFGAAASMNANELMLIKHDGGGTVVRGALDAPQVTDYPGIPSTRGATNIPVPTPLGLVYGTRDGVYAWAGGDQVTPLSPQLEGWFWKPEDGSTGINELNTPHGKFAYQHPFVLAPNNWVFDTRTNAWFRLSDPSVRVFKDYNPSSGGYFWAHPGKITGDNQVVAQRFDPAVGAHQYSWRSQPLERTKNRSHDFREVQIVAQGVGTVTVTVKGLGVTEGAATFTINSDRPVAQFAAVNVRGHDIELVITSTGAAGDSVATAPVVYRASLGYQTGAAVN